MEDLDFTSNPPAARPAAPPAAPPPAASAPFKPATSPFFNPVIAARLFQASGKKELFAPGQVLFAEADKATKGGLFKSATRMYFLEDGEVALTIGGKPLDTIRKGEVFGEMAVISERPRSATATAKTAVSAFSLDAGELQGALQKTPEFALMLMSVMFDRLRFIAARLSARKAGPPVAGREGDTFEPKLLEQFEAALPRSAIVRYNGGQNIMKEGQTGTYMYIVKSGRVLISIRDTVVEAVNPGGKFGEMAIVDQSPRTASATAEVFSELLAIDRASLLEAVKVQPVFALAMLRAVADRLRHMTAQLA